MTNGCHLICQIIIAFLCVIEICALAPHILQFNAKTQISAEIFYSLSPNPFKSVKFIRACVGGVAKPEHLQLLVLDTNGCRVAHWAAYTFHVWQRTIRISSGPDSCEICWPFNTNYFLILRCVAKTWITHTIHKSIASSHALATFINFDSMRRIASRAPPVFSEPVTSTTRSEEPLNAPICNWLGFCTRATALHRCYFHFWMEKSGNLASVHFSHFVRFFSQSHWECVWTLVSPVHGRSSCVTWFAQTIPKIHLTDRPPFMVCAK